VRKVTLTRFPRQASADHGSERQKGIVEHALRIPS
jgi:hypothetical protein